MKKSRQLVWSLLSVVILGWSCKKDNATADSNTFNSTISAGTWTITSYTQKTENKTSDFAGMDFTFSNNGTITVTGAESATGSWSYTPPVAGSYGSSTTPATFTINVVSGSEFSKLSRTWNVGSSSATSLQLDHPEASEDEHVTFTKK